MIRLPYLLIPAVVILLSGAAFASGLEHATEWSWTRDGGRIVNSLVVLGLVAWLIIKYGAPALRKRAELIAEKFDSLEKARRDAKAQLDDYKKKLAQITVEAEKIREESRSEGENIKKKIVEQAEASAKQIVSKASERIALETEAAREKLRQETIAAAVNLAEELLKKNMGPDDQKRLIREYLDKVERVKN